MTPRHLPKAYGAQELATAVGASRASVSMWLAHSHHEILEPDLRLACGPIWLDSKELRAWIKTTRAKVSQRHRRRRMAAMKRAQEAAMLL